MTAAERTRAHGLSRPPHGAPFLPSPSTRAQACSDLNVFSIASCGFRLDLSEDPLGFSDRCSKCLTMGENRRNTDARIAISKATRNMIRSKKRGGETYDRLLRKMAIQYEPDEAPAEA